MTNREQQIIDLSDAGVCPLEIAARLRLSEAYVRSRIQGLAISDFQYRRDCAALRAGSAKLTEAIEQLRLPARPFDQQTGDRT